MTAQRYPRNTRQNVTERLRTDLAAALVEIERLKVENEQLQRRIYNLTPRPLSELLTDSIAKQTPHNMRAFED